VPQYCSSAVAAIMSASPAIMSQRGSMRCASAPVKDTAKQTMPTGSECTAALSADQPKTCCQRGMSVLIATAHQTVESRQRLGTYATREGARTKRDEGDEEQNGEVRVEPSLGRSVR
jgi:hypothetical protein